MTRVVIKECAICGKRFPAFRQGQKFCGKACRYTSIELRNEMLRKKRREGGTKGQLCWRCGNATGKCPWSRDLTPIKGWDAVRAVIKDSKGNMLSYKIKKCPLYIPD